MLTAKQAISYYQTSKHLEYFAEAFRNWGLEVVHLEDSPQVDYLLQSDYNEFSIKSFSINSKLEILGAPPDGYLIFMLLFQDRAGRHLLNGIPLERDCMISFYGDRKLSLVSPNGGLKMAVFKIQEDLFVSQANRIHDPISSGKLSSQTIAFPKHGPSSLHTQSWQRLADILNPKPLRRTEIVEYARKYMFDNLGSSGIGVVDRSP